MNQLVPQPTVNVGLAAGAVALIVVWLVKLTWKIEVPNEIAMAITTALTFLSQYLPSAGRQPPPEQDTEPFE
jgi:hypothetical protein